MTRYRIYLLRLDGALIDSVELNCDDDGAAVAELTKYFGQAPKLELWNGRRLVGRIQPEAESQ